MINRDIATADFSFGYKSVTYSVVQAYINKLVGNVLISHADSGSRYKYKATYNIQECSLAVSPNGSSPAVARLTTNTEAHWSAVASSNFAGDSRNLAGTISFEFGSSVIDFNRYPITFVLSAEAGYDKKLEVGTVYTTLLNNSPTMSLSSPTNNQTFIKGTDIPFVWSASDPDGDSLTFKLQVGTSPGSVNITDRDVGSNKSYSGISTQWNLGTYYWRVIANDGKGGVVTSAERTFVINNTLPTLTLTSPPNNQTLSEGNTYKVEGSATEVDTNNNVVIKYQISEGPIRNAGSGVSNGSTPISFARTLTYSSKRIREGSIDVTGVDLAENTDHTLKVWAEDDQGGKSAEVTRKFKVIWNRPPTISGSNSDLGTILQPPTVNYSVTDPESNTFTLTEYHNGKQIRSFAGVVGQQYKVEISQDAWARLDLGVKHQIKIVATDSLGLSSERIYTFTRTETHIEFLLNFDSPNVRGHFTLDGMPLRVLLTLERYLPEGATIESVKVCNNALDATPTWEDATNAVKAGRGYLFTNKTKTAVNWAINVWVIIAKGTANERVKLNGYGGAFD